jgi:hypothetical protein
MSSARQRHHGNWRISLLELSPYMFDLLADLVWKVLHKMICPQLVNITMGSEVFPYWNCHHICLSSWWARCGKYSPRWYGINSSISQCKVTYFLIGIATVHVWVLGGLGVERAPLDDMSPTRQYDNERWRISPLELSPYMFEFVVGSMWKSLR